MSLASKLSITDVDVKGKRVLIRVSSGAVPPAFGCMGSSHEMGIRWQCEGLETKDLLLLMYYYSWPASARVVGKIPNAQRARSRRGQRSYLTTTWLQHGTAHTGHKSIARLTT